MSAQQTKKQLQQELDAIPLMSKKMYRMSLFRWLTRNLILVGAYIMLWNKFTWLPYTLFLTIPLALFGLFVIYQSYYAPRRKGANTEQLLHKTNMEN